MLWCFLGFKGRLSREPYFLGLIIMTILATLFLAPMLEIRDGHVMMAESAFPLPVLVISQVVQFALAIKRLHDFNRAGLYSIILVFPGINLVFAVLLGLVPGTAGPNRFGDAANTPPG